MARHDQRGLAPTFVCIACKAERCRDCIDVMRAVYTMVPLCNCKRKNHNGEPIDQQVVDLFNNSVHGPGLIVTEDGEVEPK